MENLTQRRKGNSRRVLWIMLVLVAYVFALDLIYLKTQSIHQGPGQAENGMFMVHESDRILPVRHRDPVNSHGDRFQPESVLPLGDIQMRERREGVQKDHRGLVRGDTQRRPTELLGPKETIKVHLPMQDGNDVDGRMNAKRKQRGDVLAGETKVNASADLSARNTEGKPQSRRNGTNRIGLRKRVIKLRRARRYNNTLKEPVNGLSTNNGHRQNLFRNMLKGNVSSEGMEVVNIANKTARKSMTGVHSHNQGGNTNLSNMNAVKFRGKCTRLITLYTPNVTPFGYWPEYSDLKRLFEDGQRYSGNIESSPTGYVVCPDQPCDINLIPTNDDTILAASDATLLNLAPLLVKPNASKISERLLNNLPKKVKIVFYAMESANMMTFWDNSIRDIQFHYSMTYHSSSDVVHPYGRYVQGNPMDSPDQPMNHTEGKTKILAWMASNCNFTFWPRYEWVSRLQEFIHVDIHGRCGQATCLPRFSKKCVDMMKSYKFYLALENTQCDEYMTEKFWDNCLLNGVVPVVYGGRRETYEKIAPPGSFIYAADFAGPKDLADYLIKLDKDDERYSGFFAWRKYGRVEKIYPNLRPTAFCDLLPLLSPRENERVPIKRVGDTKYFLGCREDKDARFIERGDINNWSPWK